MSVPQKFRSAFNGFNREDVVSYLEYLNNKHASQVNLLTAEADSLRLQLEACAEAPVCTENTAALEEECASLRQQVAQLQARCAELEEKLARQNTAAPAVPVTPAVNELEAYRRAERTERQARERAELIQRQANAILSDVTFRVNDMAAQVVPVADDLLAQLKQIQDTVTASRQSFQDAVVTLNCLRSDI